MRRGWLVAASIGAVEGLKDQVGLCRWNYGIRVLQQHAYNSLKSASTYNHRAAVKKPISAPASSSSSSSSSVVFNKMIVADETTKKSEESFRIIMYLSCCIGS